MPIIILVTLMIILMLGIINIYIVLPIIFSVFCLFMAIYYKNKFKTWLNLYTLISIIFIFGFCIRYISLIYGYNHFNIPKESMTFSLIYAFLIYVIFLIGSSLGRKISFKFDIKIITPSKIETLLIIILNFILSYGAIFILLVLFGGWDNITSSFSDKTDEFAGLGIIFTFIASLSVSLILLLCLKAIDFDKKTLIIFLISIIPLFSSGGRILFFLVILSALLIFEIRTKAIGFVKFSIVGLIGFIFFVSYFAYFRVYIKTESWEYFNNNWYDLLYNTLVNGALSFIDGLNVIMYYVPSTVEHLGGLSLLSSLIIFIPSILISNKPDNTALLYNEVFNSSQYLSGTGQNPSLIGEVYWNLGAFNTVILFFFCGVLIGILYKKIINSNYNSKLISTISLVFLLPIFLFLIKSGLSSGTPYRILLPLAINLMFLMIINRVKVIRGNVED